MSTADTYDALLIGTGPPMLFQALALAEAGARVILVDAAAHPGGSWHLPEVLGYRSVEVGVHLIENRAYIHRVIENLLPEQEILRDTPDFGLWRGRRIPMRLARVLLHGLVAGKSALGGKGEKTRHALANTGLALRHLPLPILYPRRGYGAIMAAALARLDAAGARVVQNARIERLHVSASGVLADTAQGPIRARRLVMSSRAHAPITGMEALWQECQRIRTFSAVLHLEGPPPDFAGYVEVIGHRVVKRARNVTAFAVPGVAPGQSLVTVQFRNDPRIADPAALGGEARDGLVRLGLLSPESRLLGTHRDDFDLATLPAHALAAIEARYPDRVTVLRTVDLGDQAYAVGPAPLRLPAARVLP
ncbi:hypothetical protein [Haematobacter massiliensis]|uniref:hypothetical protein n=1 Tax=Haematobacter massiliensis TaxID=195105 RepID=UPI0023F05C9F|nr:hypothetical protein [Haematobacter massiliensis]